MHNNDDDVIPLLSLQNTVPGPGGSGDGVDYDSVDHGVTHAYLYDDAQSDNDDDSSEKVLEAILGRVSQREDTIYDDNGADVSVGVNVSAVVGVSVHGQSVNLGVGLGVSLVVGLLPRALTSKFRRLLGSPSEILEFQAHDLSYHLPF